ncbi:MAG: SET domain-containing protein [Gammaproteobacteria bacterium]|nr:MAG: SET domain-containing protein [Gammaproteobacteria bacterium]
MTGKALVCCDILVKKSPIHGYGVFANQDIPAGEVIEECYALPITEQVLNDYAFQNGHKKNVLLLGCGSIYNHSSTPCANFVFDEERFLMIFRANRLIKQGEEIYISYGPEWFSSRHARPIEPSFWFKLKKWLPVAQILARFAIVVGALSLLVTVMKSFHA